jgi:SpoIID/LytB domain protein
MYGGVAAERTETNVAIGATAGQVLVWRDRIVPGYYFSSSGGRTSSVHDAWPRAAQVPYLVSVNDPYDYLSPHHVWPTQVLSAANVASALGVSGVRDIQVLYNSSGRARAVRVLTIRGWRQFSGDTVRTKFDLGSMDFDLHAMEIDDPGRVLFGQSVHVTGFVRGLGRARLQQLTEAGWVTVRHVRISPTGRFDLALRAVQTTEFRLAYNGLAGDPVGLQVAPRVLVSANGARVRARVSPALPLQVERLTNRQWRTVARARGVFDRNLRPGSYRITVRGTSRYAGETSAPVAVHSA